MRACQTLLVLLVAVAPLVVCALPIAPAGVDRERVTDFARGTGLGLFATDAEYDYAHLLDEVVAHGATDVLIIVAWYQTDVSSHDIHRRRAFSPSDATVLRTLRQAKARGLRTALLPIVRLQKRSREQWRGRIAPAAGEGAWFEAYGEYVMRMAELAESAHIERFGVGSELLSMERHEAQWRELIAQVRGRYAGRLFYSANWDHFDPIRFWDAVDDVGLTAYFELAGDLVRPTPEQLAEAWRAPRFQLSRLKARVKKPVIITEIGYPSLVTAARYPWDETRKAKSDPELQRLLYEAFCEAFVGQGVIDGMYFWNWFGFGGEHDTTYTPRNKPAATQMKSCLEDKAWDSAARRRL